MCEHTVPLPLNLTSIMSGEWNNLPRSLSKEQPETFGGNIKGKRKRKNSRQKRQTPSPPILDIWTWPFEKPAEAVVAPILLKTVLGYTSPFEWRKWSKVLCPFTAKHCGERVQGGIWVKFTEASLGSRSLWVMRLVKQIPQSIFW